MTPANRADETTPLGPGAEFDAIRALLAQWGARATGIGDDAAALRPVRGDELVISVDAFVEGRHFQPGWLNAREVGYRAVAAALSDMAAMAATPAGVLISVIVPPTWRERLPDLANGVGDAAELAGTHIVGGNLSGGVEFSLTTTVLGTAFAPLLRSGAQVGDDIYVTGRLGGPGAALSDLASGAVQVRHRGRFVHPVPRLGEARWLSAHGATAAIDISDGLAADLAHLAAASACTLVVDARSVPCVDGVSVEAAIQSGEEYELVVTTSEAFDTATFAERFGIPLTRIGRIAAGAPNVEWHGVRVANPHGHDHFSA